MMVLNVINIFFSMLKIMQFLRVFKGQGMLVQLITQCLEDIVDFMLLMTFWLLGIALMFKTAGAEMHDEDYDGLSP
jgi:hypothetical protein